MEKHEEPLHYFNPGGTGSDLVEKAASRQSRRLRRIILYGAGLVLMLVIIGISVPIYCSHCDKSPVNATRASISMIKQILSNFDMEFGRFPTTAEGLDSLVHQPAGLADWHPFTDKLPIDTWGNWFAYRCPSTTGQPYYDLYSIGPDGIDGTPDDIYENP